MRRSTLLAGLAALGLALGPAALAHNEGLPSVPVTTNKMTHVQNRPNTSGNSMAFFERRQSDGTLKRYLVAAVQGNGFDILEVTDPAHPITVGRYLLPELEPDPNKLRLTSAGVNYHAWVDVNPRRNIVALSVEEPAVTVRHGLGAGVVLVDITDVTAPKPIATVKDKNGNELNGPHTLKMIGDNHIYTSFPTYVIDYTDPTKAVGREAPEIEGHEFFPDPNNETFVFAGLVGAGRWGYIDATNPAAPKIIKTFNDTKITAAHEVYPSADGSFVGIADFESGQATLACPGGGIHFYDISGKHVPGATLMFPKKMGAWFAPTSGLTGPNDQGNGTVNNASCTMHSWQPQGERHLNLGGLYAGGTFVFDSTAATLTGGGEYTEWADPTPNSGSDRGKTTWGNSRAHIRDAIDYVNASQWLPFDLTDPEHERLAFVNGWVRGLDVYRYTGAMPLKHARLRVGSSAPGGVVSGVLDRYAVMTYQGWRNKPLAFRDVEVSGGGTTMTVSTGADGSFSASLGLPAGTHQVSVTYPGDDSYQAKTVTMTVAV